MDKKPGSPVSSATQPPPPSPPPMPSTTVDPTSEPPTLAVEPPDPIIIHLGLQAIEELQNGNNMKALKMIQLSISKHRDSPHLLCVEALVYNRLAQKAPKDSEKKLEYLTKALQSARLALEELPDSFYFTSVLADIMYQLEMMDAGEWQDVIELCEAVLYCTTNPTDPGVDRFLEEDEMVNSSKESRIEEEKKLIRNYIRASQCQIDLNLAVEAAKLEKPTQGNDVTNCVVAVMDMRKKQIEAIIWDWILLKHKISHFSIKKVKVNAEKEKKYKGFWSSELSDEKKRDFCEVSIRKLERHAKSLKSNLAMDLLEAIRFFEKSNTWRYWECRCHEKFSDCEMYRNHSRKLHGIDVESFKEEIGVGGGRAEIILKGEWKPLRTDVAREFIGNQLKLESHSTESNTNILSGICMDNKKWPWCVDIKRKEILESILKMFRLLLRNKCLTTAHLIWPILYTMNKFEIIIPQSQLYPEMLKFICFLEASDLEEILDFLNKLADNCGLVITETGSYLDYYRRLDLVSDMKQRIGISKDLSWLLVDERILGKELDDSAVTFPVNVGEGNALPDDDDLVSWLYEGPMIGEDLESLKNLRNCQREKAAKVCQIFDVESLNLVTIGNEKSLKKKKLEAIQGLERICLEEIKKMETNPEHVAQDYVNLLRVRQKDLQGNECIAGKMESEIISNVLKEALVAEAQVDPTCDQPGFEEHGPENELRLQERLKQRDNRIRLTLQRLLKELTKDIAVVNAIILQSAGSIQLYELILEKMSAYDYQSIIIPLMKSFLQKQLEEDEMNAVAAEFEPDATKGLDKDCHNVRQKPDNNKNKKKRMKKVKIFKKEGEFKAISDGEKIQLSQQNAVDDNPNPESGASISASGASLKVNVLGTGLKNEQTDYSVSDTGVSATADEQNQPEKEMLDKNLRHQVQSLVSDTMHGSNSLGPGLENNYGDRNCFLNVIIQSLQHLRTFHEKFMSRTHEHVGRPCVVCALHDVFVALHEASMSNKTSVTPLPLRKALSHLHANEANNKKNFQMGEENDPLEALQAILQHLQKSFTSDSASRIDFDDSSNTCLVDEIFGMKIKLQSNHVHTLIHEWSISQIITISAEELRDLKSTHGNRSFDELVKLKLEQIANMQIQGSSVSTAGDGRTIHANVTNWLPPEVIIIGCHILKSQEISEVLNNLSTTLNISIDSQGLDLGNKYILFSLVFFQPSGSHYTCFIRTNERERCLWYNDTLVEDSGSWDDVFMKSIDKHMQPHTLLFKTKKLEEPSDEDTTQKSDAETEYLSAEHATDAKNNINEVSDNVGQNEDEKKKTVGNRAEESKATSDSEKLQHHQTDAEDNNPNSEICKEKKLLEENSEYQRQNKGEAKGTCPAERSENIVESLGENEGVSATNSNGHENNNENRLQADIRKAVRLSLDSYERQISTLPADVKDGTTLQSDVYQYVIMQSQWRLRQLRDEFMSGCEQQHQIHDRNLCFHSAYLDSLAALRIASRDGPNEVFAMISLSTTVKLPIDNFIGELPLNHFIEELNKQDQVDEGATEINVPESASEMENQLAAIVMNIMEVLEQERQQKEVNLVAGKKRTLQRKIMAEHDVVACFKRLKQV